MSATRGSGGSGDDAPRARATGAPPRLHDASATSTPPHHSTADATTDARPSAAWSIEGATFRHARAARPTLDDVTLHTPAGRCTVVIGPNGAGKSTLLRLCLGTLAPHAGAVRFEGRAMAEWDRRALARAVGVVPQAETIAFPITVRDLVAMGRYPHLGAWRREREVDRAHVQAAMRATDVDALAERDVGTLSGGERQRALVARALAVAPRALVLDEPTAALDVRHEMAIFELVRAWTSCGMTALVVTHHLNLAARYADHLVLLDEGRVAAAGAPADVLTEARVRRVYGWPVVVVPHPGPGPDAGAPQIVPLAPVAGDATVDLAGLSTTPSTPP